MTVSTRAIALVVLSLALAVVSLPSVYAADVLGYVGETTSMTSYQGSLYSDTMWDYVYNIDGWNPAGRGTWVWGIQVAAPVDVQTDVFSPAGWLGHYSSVLGGVPELSALNGQQVVWWEYLGEGGSGSGFHFRSTLGPAVLMYQGGPTNNTTHIGNAQTGVGYDLSAASVPEPATLSLASLCLIGGGWARRRWRKNGKHRAA